MTEEPTTTKSEEETVAGEAQDSDEIVEETAVATEDEPEGEKEEEEKKIDQQVDITDAGPCKKHVKVTINRGDIDSRLNEKYTELVNDAEVRGFRKGKAPRKVIERQFRRDVNRQIKGELLMGSLEQMADEYDIAPITQPNFDPTKIDIPEKGPLIYEFDVEVRPQFDLPDYKALKIKRPIRDFSDEDVDREQRRLLSEFGQLIPKDGPAELEDYIIADMVTKQDDKVIGSAKELTLRVDKQLAFKDGVAETFGEQVTGAKAGDERIVDIKMSDTVANAKLAGQIMKATLEIKDVKKLRLPELTHEFLHTFGVHSEDELREELMALLKRRLEYHQRQSARQQILQQIEQHAKLELPQDLLLRQSRRALSRRAMEMQDAGMSDKEIQGQLRIMQQDIVRSTALSLKEHFVLQKIAELEKIDISEEEIDQEVEAMADENDESPRRVRARLEREGQLETLAGLLVERKALDLILESAEYEDVPLDQPHDEAVGVSEEQAVEGEMRDPGEEAEKAAEAGEVRQVTESSESEEESTGDKAESSEEKAED